MLAELLAPQRALELVAGGLNRLLARDAGLRAQLAPLQGRTLEVRVVRFGWRVVVAFEQDSLLLATSSAHPVDVSLEGSLSDLLALGRARQRGEPIPAGRIRLQGDLATVQQVQAVMDSLLIDWEGFLAQYLGPLPARQVARVIAGLGAFVRQFQQAVERDLAEYLRTESGLLPAAPELERFHAAVLQLAQDADRFAARVQRLQRRRQAP